MTTAKQGSHKTTTGYVQLLVLVKSVVRHACANTCVITTTTVRWMNPDDWLLVKSL